MCECCGSKGVHEHCLGAKAVFVCDDCEPPSKKRKKMPEPIDVISDQENDINNNIPLKTSLPYVKKINNLPSEISNPIAHFVPLRIKLKLPCLNRTDSVVHVTDKVSNKRKRQSNEY